MLAFSSLSYALADDHPGSWRVVSRERGIVVSVRDEPNKPLPSFRGQGSIRGAVLHVLAVMLDDRRSPEWAGGGADEAGVLRRIDAHTHIVYSHSDQPWPVHDRDLVMKRTVHVEAPGESFRVRLVCVPDQRPLRAGVVRITDCDTVFSLRKVDEATTFIDYRVHVDPGGDAPAWLVRRASRNMPRDTLLSLERQVAKTKGQYDATMRTWAAAR